MINICIINRQRTKRINARFLHGIVRGLISKLRLETVNLGISLVTSSSMASVNQDFLQHEGPTDVITFDHTTNGPIKSRRGHHSSKADKPVAIHGELYICVEVAIRQAGEFKTTWQAEVVRYIVHGILHLLGYDDLQPSLRQTMKRKETQLVKHLAAQFSFAQLEATPKTSRSDRPGRS